VKLLPYGPRAVLAEFDSLAEVMVHASAWRAAALPGVVDVVPAARTVLVAHDGSLQVAALFSVAATGAAAEAESALVTIDVDYDGPDLGEVAERCGLTVEEVVTLHSGAEYSVAFCGFMPGFAYLIGLPVRLQLPRRTTPRTRVPAGAVAIASEFASVYPRQSPGGWHLLGTTDTVLWINESEPPALLTPGTIVRFRRR